MKWLFFIFTFVLKFSAKVRYIKKKNHKQEFLALGLLLDYSHETFWCNNVTDPNPNIESISMNMFPIESKILR